MTLFLTGSPCKKGEDHFTEENGLLDELKRRLPQRPDVVLVSAAPDDRGYNGSVFESTEQCIIRSGIEPSAIVMIKRNNAADAGALIRRADMVVLCGGHVPTQNKFFKEIGLKSILEEYDGVIVACSAGAMNCADRVYSHPELPGEGTAPAGSRWLSGLGLTHVNLIPHLEDVRHYRIDGRRLFEDIIFPDSFGGNTFTTFRDGAYILSEDGHETVRGEAFTIKDGQIFKSNPMNVIFFSPHFPATYSHFCRHLKENGANVLGIADAPYETLGDELKSSLTEYYRVNDLEDYGEVFRAVAYFSFKYGKIDWIESNNEYWLEQNARIRTDFNITTGIRIDHIAAIKEKSEMKKYYALGGVPTARQIRAAEGLKAVKAFASKTGYPIIAKPDNGVGADGTFKLQSDAELEDFFKTHAANYGAFVVEEFVTGLLTSYDAVYNSKGEPVFESMGVYPTPIMDIVHDNLEACYYIEKSVPKALSEMGRRTVKAFGITSRFVHLEFFKLDRDREGLGRKGDFVGLEVNMRPAGGYTPDMMNFAHSTDVYKIWADMVVFDECRKEQGEQFYCAYASRRNGKAYAHTHTEITERYGDVLTMSAPVPEALSQALCDYCYIAKFKNLKEVEAFFRFITA
ncbi:MAG: hypothetical protein MJY44_02695 [Bacteroidales bacterium]|nr:hypothetical protein [Bacteroidales bacterium]